MRTRCGSKGLLIVNHLLSGNVLSNRLVQGHAEMCTGKNRNIGNKSCAAIAVRQLDTTFIILESTMMKSVKSVREVDF